mmetsp:Transcript_113453/g.201179  ORF Transcript_113453/g.201179 Transcript_113453/m.201179 type:complete len:106 (+) Transcript_113453:103-420(+)
MSKITLLLACLACASSGWRVQVPGHHSQVIGTARTARRPTMQDDDFLVNLAKDPKNMLSADTPADPLFGSPPAAAPAAAAPADATSATAALDGMTDEEKAAAVFR